MDKNIYKLLKLCVMKGVTEHDLGIMLKWAVRHEDNFIHFLHMIEEYSKEKFFDHSERIADIAAHYREILEIEIDTLT